MLRFVVFIALFAVVVYAGFWLLDRRRGRGGKKGAKPMPRGPVGPDDDEDFLRELERRRRHSKDGKPKAQPKNTQPKDTRPKDTPPKRDPRPSKGPHPKDSQAKDVEPNNQPKPQPKDAQPNEGEA